jgi:beta-glucosidase
MDLEAWLAELTLDEKAELTAGADMWSTPAIERAGLPAVRVTDGPNGARGQALLGLGTVTAACIPCGSALGASWNPELVERLGVLLGEEAHTKAARVLLAPTINLHRSPLGGRNFECLSEDPLLAGKLAAAYVRGVQSQGVATTAKHFVANEAEFERHTIDSVVDERTLRELYLVPFELVVKEGGGLGVMTSYNRVNGEYCSESAWLLSQVLREEWGFQGFIVTDWFAAGDTVASLRAGLDLQMPGPGRFFGEALAAAVRDGRVDEAELDAPVARMLSVWERLGALEDTGKDAERSVDLPEHRTLAREAAREAIVLLRNDGTLPLDASGLQRVAVIGPNAERGQIMGGGSAALRPHYRVGPLEALRAALPSSVEVVYERGCWTERTIPALGGAALARGGEPGFEVELFTNPGFEGRPAQVLREHEAEFLYFGEPAPGIPAEEFSLRARTTFTPRESGRHTFSLIQSGRAQLAIGDQIVIDGVADPPARGEAFFSMGSAEVTVEVELVAGEPVELSIEYSTDSAVLLRGVRIGHKPPASQDDLARAERAAAAADAVVLVVGTNADWESEGEDRGSMDLPGEQDALIRRVCAANPRTIVCVNAGSPVTMDWARSETSRARTRSSVMARRCWWATAGTTRASSRCGSRSATGSPTPRSRSASPCSRASSFARASSSPSKSRSRTRASGRAAWCCRPTSSRRLRRCSARGASCVPSRRQGWRPASAGRSHSRSTRAPSATGIPVTWSSPRSARGWDRPPTSFPRAAGPAIARSPAGTRRPASTGSTSRAPSRTSCTPARSSCPRRSAPSRPSPTRCAACRAS